MILTIAVLVIVCLAVLMTLLIRRRHGRRVLESQDDPLNDLYRSYLNSMHNEARRYLKNEAPPDREWIEGIKAEARANVGVGQVLEIDFGPLKYIRDFDQSYIAVPLQLVALARASA